MIERSWSPPFKYGIYPFLNFICWTLFFTCPWFSPGKVNPHIPTDGDGSGSGPSTGWLSPREDGDRMDKAEEPWPQGLVSRVTWDLGPAGSAWRELQEVCILFPVVAEVKSRFLFTLKLSHLDCFCYSNQCMYLDMYMVWYPKASSHLQFHFTVNLKLFVWNQGDVAGERSRLTKLGSMRERPGSKESTLIKQTKHLFPSQNEQILRLQKSTLKK